jgi:EAL domain-containing protein (putative c-di-GMP-specific phosphodiesterase class I)
MSLCRRCEVLPDKIEDSRDYYLWFPLGHSESKVRQVLSTAGISTRADTATDAVVLSATPDLFKDLAHRLIDTLSSEEIKATRVLPVRPSEGPGARDYPAVTSLHQMMTFLESGWLLDAMAREEFRIGFSPIAFADSVHDIYAHQAVIDMQDAAGQPIDSLQMLQLAQQAGLLFQADRLSRISAIKAAQRARVTTPIFVNFSPASIYDPTYCLRTTVAALDETEVKRDAVCFTIVSPERWDDTKHLRNILEFYRGTGFRVAMGGVGSGSTSLTLIETLRPDVIFIDRAIIAGIERDAYRQVIARKLLEMAHRLRIESVVSGVGTDGELNWAYEHGANYVEGAYVQGGTTVPGGAHA